MAEECIFCKIIKGEVPCHKVYEDADYLAFLSIAPEAPGHALIIPKGHYRWVWDMPNAGKAFEVVQKIALAQKKAFDTDFIISKVIGEDVPHAHFHVYPGSSVKGEKKDTALNAEKIRKELK